MGKVTFSPMEIDALGEMTNISLGSSATAVSNMLDHRVDITTPSVSVVAIDEFALGDLEPAMGVEIKYVEGLTGSNLMLLRRSDIKVIVDILMGMEGSPDEDFELNELTISAVCEVMNQMMGAASTAMSEFLGFPVNISTPVPFELDDMDKFKKEHLPHDADSVVVIRFSFKIENAIESEFMNVMSVPLAKELLRGLGLESPPDAEEAEQPAPAEPAGGSDRQMSQEEIEQMMAQMAGGSAQPEPEPQPSGGDHMMSQEEIEQMMAQMAGGSAQPEPEPRPSGGDHMMSQEEIEKMMGQMADGSAQPEPQPSGGDHMMSQEEIERMLAAQTAPAPTAPTPAPAPAQPQPAPAPTPTAPPVQPPVQPPMPEGQPVPPYMGQAPYGAPPYGYMPMYYPYPQQPVQPDPKVIETKPVELPQLDVESMLGKEQSQNLDLIMDVPLQVTVEIGRSRRKVQEILEFTKGSLVILDKLAGDQVDLFVNGKCIAKGDVVVIDDNFGVRITEIVKNSGVGSEVLQK